MTPFEEFDRSYAAEQLRRSRHPLRKLIKHFYLNSILREVRGPTIDFGCGAGQLLRRLPAGSIGLEVNPVLVDTHTRAGLNVVAYDPVKDQLALSDLAEGSYKTFVISHVLEHLPDAAESLRQICRSCYRLGVERLVVVVPGEKGFHSDKTHKTFVTEAYLHEQGLLECEGFSVVKTEYFPLNIEAIGKSFVFHEMKIVYERKN